MHERMNPIREEMTAVTSAKRGRESRTGESLCSYTTPNDMAGQPQLPDVSAQSGGDGRLVPQTCVSQAQVR